MCRLSITRYDIYRNSDELNQNFVMVGFGTASRVTKDNERVENEDDGAQTTTHNGADQATIASKHFGWNTFDLQDRYQRR